VKKTFLPSNGQGSLEYLLLIGGVLAVAAVVVFFLLSQNPTQHSSERLRQNALATECNQTCAFIDNCTHYVTTFDDPQVAIDECTSDCKKDGFDRPVVTAEEYDFDCKIDKVWK